jgi:hypothetical protein
VRGFAALCLICFFLTVQRGKGKRGGRVRGECKGREGGGGGGGNNAGMDEQGFRAG